MDTDSNYMALSAELFQCVKPECWETFPQEFERWMVEPYCSNHRQQFWNLVWMGEDTSSVTSQTCCRNHYRHDSRTPGKFKQEFKGDAIVALNSKTYICSASGSATTPANTKLSSKGLSKRTNSLSLNHFRSVLRSRRHVHGVNTGFVRKNNKTLTYSMIKRGLTYFYPKRLVCSDGVSTEPLDV